MADADFRRPAIGSHLIVPDRRAFDTTAPIRRRVQAGRTYWFAGPDRARIEAATGTRIQAVRVTPPRPGLVTSVPGAGHVRSAPLEAHRPRTFARSLPGPVAAPPFHHEPQIWRRR